MLRSANALLGTAFAEIQGIGTLPLGISFYTFQTLSYLFKPVSTTVTRHGSACLLCTIISFVPCV